MLTWIEGRISFGMGSVASRSVRILSNYLAKASPGKLLLGMSTGDEIYGSVPQLAPLMAAQDYGSTIGGLLGQYQNTTTTQKQGLGGMLAGLGGSALAGWASGGWKGI